MTFWEFIAPISIELETDTPNAQRLIWSLLIFLVNTAFNAAYLYVMIRVIKAAWQ